jgi:hypothetical protein
LRFIIGDPGIEIENTKSKQEQLEICWHLEEFAPLGALDAAAADTLDADAHLPYRAADLHADILEIGLELPPADPGYLAADTAQVFGLAAARVLIAQYRFFPANGTLHAHGSNPVLAVDRQERRPGDYQKTQYSDLGGYDKSTGRGVRIPCESGKVNALC